MRRKQKQKFVQLAELPQEELALLKESALEILYERSAFGRTEEVQDYFPEDYGKQIPKEGAWIMVTLPPLTEYSVPKFSVWYAMNAPKDMESDHPLLRLRTVVIITPRGELLLYPHEYVLMDFSKYMNEMNTQDLAIHYFAEKQEIAQNEKIFYLQSRGIGKAEAIMMLLGELKDPKLRHYCYFTFHDAYLHVFMREEEFSRYLEQKRSGFFGIEFKEDSYE